MSQCGLKGCGLTHTHCNTCMCIVPTGKGRLSKEELACLKKHSCQENTRRWEKMYYNESMLNTKLRFMLDSIKSTLRLYEAIMHDRDRSMFKDE